jgi:hypothetical protein
VKKVLRYYDTSFRVSFTAALSTAARPMLSVR